MIVVYYSQDFWSGDIDVGKLSDKHPYTININAENFRGTPEWNNTFKFIDFNFDWLSHYNL